ncbi:porin OmpL1 [Leptospira sp. GIMC2001]|uniref:porin OmpL1 n=1 Tax=Leptospira sp. GIMC2001 TaxID=1513297 RepID=UPI00234B2904|nr:porin OmpL1 [Leptospira sp. GIMC2001]WCL49339.1 porin OmpL1 [Leptospira sp. GIMC2001]
MFKRLVLLYFILMGPIVLADETRSGSRYFLMFGIGYQSDLGGIGPLITTGGLESAVYVPNSEGTGSLKPQTAIYSERSLQSLNDTTLGFVGVNANGQMNGLNLNLGYEVEGIFGLEMLFARMNINYTKKISGGYTSSTVAGYKWLEQEWDYTAVTIPGYLGYKIYNKNKSSGLYAGFGMNYFRGGWTFSGTIDGDTIALAFPGLVGPGGQFLNDAPSPSIIYENAKFLVNGFGFNWLVGIQTQISSRGFLFFEMETILAANMGKAYTKSIGGTFALSPYPAFPVLVGGDTYRIGYKISL